MGIAAIVDKAGPALVTGITLAVLSGAATVVVAWRDLASTSAVRFSYLTSELQQLRADLETFRSPGGRFTSHDGDRHWQRMDDLDRRIRDQEMRPPRLNPALDSAVSTLNTLERRLSLAEQQLEHMEAEQERLCARLQACKGSSR